MPKTKKCLCESCGKKVEVKKRPLSDYNKFVKKHMGDFDGPVTERMKKIAVMWRGDH